MSTTAPISIFRVSPLLTLLAAATLALHGCGSVSSSLRENALTSTADGSGLSSRFPTQVYYGNETNVADFYLTDLPPSVWEQGGDVSDLEGTIVHIHMFVVPKPGKTPIQRTASSSTVRWLVLSKGRVGVYGGGGFFSESGEVGEDKFGGTLYDASLRLIRSTPGFKDPLGPSVLSVSVSAKKDQKAAEAISRAFTSLSN